MSTAPTLDDLVDSYLDVMWSLDPVAATAAGVQVHDGRVGAHGEEDVRQHVSALKAITGSLESVGLESLADEVDRTALLDDVRVTIHRFEREQPHVRNPTFWVSHLLEGVYLLLALKDRDPTHASRAMLERLRAAPEYLRVGRETLRDCPRVFVETASEVAEGSAALLDEVERRFAEQGADEGNEPAAVCRGAATAVREFVDYLRRDLLERAPEGYAIGEDWFNFRLHYQHALRSGAPELWRYGLALMEEVEEELAQAARRLDARPSWADVADRLRGDHPAAGELVSAYAGQMERARRFVEERDLVAVPEGTLEVASTPTFLRPLIPFAAYQPPGVFSADRTGWFYVTPPDEGQDPGLIERQLRDHCVHDLPSTALHEGYPGHHLQFLTAHRQPRPVRRVIGAPIAVEGWALYCEGMMGEEGFYRSQEERLFQLVALLLRACRVVIDVGLHTRGMSFEEAVQLLTDRVHLDRAHAEAEVRRYCAEPTYQMSYAVGRRELLSLRDAFRRAAGAEYSLKRFHDELLRYGGLPISLVRWGMGLDE